MVDVGVVVLDVLVEAYWVAFVVVDFEVRVGAADVVAFELVAFELVAFAAAAAAAAAVVAANTAHSPRAAELRLELAHAPK